MQLVILFLPLTMLLGSSSAQMTLPAWLTKELQTLHAEAEDNMDSAKYLRDKIKDAMVRLQYYDNEFLTKELPLTPVGGRKYPKNCKEALSWGYNYNRYHMRYTIDPDGAAGHVKPFMVKCEKNGDEVVTEFGFTDSYRVYEYSGPHNCYDYKDWGVPGIYDYCYNTKTTVQYMLSAQEMRYAIHVSGNCTQRIDWNCHANSLLYLKAHSSRMISYGRSLTDFKYLTQGVCDCAKKSSCREAHKLCNCASDTTDKWDRDTIEITNHNSLPVREITLGDLAGHRDKAQIYVSNVICRA